MLRTTLVIGAMLLSSSLWADVPGSQDLPILPRLNEAKIVSYQQAAEQERRYPQGAISRISGKLRYERDVLASGALTRLTYELPASHSADEAFAAARTTLQEQGAHMLYWCVGRECGSSSLWANSVFANASLYGADDQQSYALLRLAAPQQDSLLALYSITRGNRRAYLHVEQLDSSSALGQILPTPATLQRQLKSQGQLQLFGQAEPTAEWVALLARSLNSDSTQRVALAGAKAEAWREALVAQRVRASRLELDSQDAEGLLVKLLR
ncbi:DUF4892 domain-containing protein [Pseudomonas sp. 5P_3.1_Bac2]|uniref:DUF4892 domain-containing protein n=1 Tax=Pseudomonas sp. 5P_3.1_Bac2 TaxID=2971617 RepID=UPI0021C79E65|nr:DUF4892 domain-containing protein [Pseudomonas sp. 5P_3.1_Bac2]MCU1716950.1 DUF4892 domain-containing protein [Pseudomonas sp. 5P_3.1_Bac2]